MTILDPSGSALIISPHLDDAVLSCGDLLYVNPSATVVTVLAGAPDAVHVGYNSDTTGKSSARDAINVRKEEDRQALEFLGASPVWMELLDSDYSAYRPATDYIAVIRDDIAHVLNDVRPTSIVAPLGLMHPDHLAVSDACIQLMNDSAFTWYIYMDLPYGLASRRQLSRRLSSVSQRVALTELSSNNSEPGIKARAFNFYASQYAPTRRNFGKRFDAALLGGERYWQVNSPL